MASNAVQIPADQDDGGPGDSVYATVPERQADKTPACLYFYYIGPFEHHVRRIRHYYYHGDGTPLSPGAVEELIVELTRNARKPEPEQSPPPTGANWDYVLWSRKSYVVILIDDPYTQFVRGDAISFKRQGGYERNHSFYQARDLLIDIPDAQGRRPCSAVQFVNLMTDVDHDDLADVAERFRFDLNTEPPLKDHIRYPDSGGTNMGPPIGPP